MKHTFSVIGQRIDQLWFAYTIESLLGIEKDPKTYNHSHINDIKMLYQISRPKKKKPTKCMMSPVFTPDKAKLEGQKIDQEIARATS